MKKSDYQTKVLAIAAELDILFRDHVKNVENWDELLLKASERVYDVSISGAARESVNVRHSKPGGSKDKRAAMLAAWKSGEYLTKNECAEKFGDKIGLKFDAARRHLRGA